MRGSEPGGDRIQPRQSCSNLRIDSVIEPICSFMLLIVPIERLLLRKKTFIFDVARVVTF